MSLEFYNHIKATAQKTPDHPALIDAEGALSYSEFLHQIEKFAAALGSLDLTPTSKLGLLCLNQREYLVAYLGALLKGVPVVPFNFLLGPEDLAFIAQDAEIDIAVIDSAFVKPEAAPIFQLFRHKILIGDTDPEITGSGSHKFSEFLHQGNPEQAKERHTRDPRVPDVLLYTSGTTAKPKGVMLDEEQFAINVDATQSHIALNSKDRVILALPLFHSFGNIIALLVFRVAGTLILLKQFQPKSILSAITEHRATILPLVPTIYSFLVQLYERGGYDVSTLTHCISGGASLPKALLKKVEETLGVVVIEGYGLTETAPVISVNTFKDGSVPGCTGPILSNVEVKIVSEQGDTMPVGEVGEILVKGKSVMRGYWKRPNQDKEAFTPDGWLKTGDLGHRDEKNRLYISAGRKKDLIIRAGENVSPLAIENVLMQHPALAEAAAVGIPDERLGEKVKACVVLREGAQAEKSELKKFCIRELPAFMIPDIIEFYDALPKNATGKILKTQLRETHKS